MTVESVLAYHCGPALAGIKTANIAACYKDKIPSAIEEVQQLNRELNCKDIYFEILCECEKRILVMVYRKHNLEEYLMSPKIKHFLESSGYPKEFSVDGYINFLKLRLNESGFPHEIGAFLGYPLHDIHGFINHKKDGCLLTGEWKVYADEENAKKLFTRYRACRKAILKRIAKGITLAQLFCAA